MIKLRDRLVLSVVLMMAISTIALPSAQALTLSSAAKKNTYAYSFNAKTLNGVAFHGQVLAGKPSVLWFWTPWCTICRAEAPDFIALTKSFKGKVNFLGVAGLTKPRNHYSSGT